MIINLLKTTRLFIDLVSFRLSMNFIKNTPNFQKLNKYDESKKIKTLTALLKYG